jgi:Phage minor tail protein.
MNEGKLTHTALNRRVEFENGNEQVQRQSVNTKVVWERKYGGLKAEMLELKSFFDAHAPGGITFYWVDDEEGTKNTVRFANDTCELQEVYGWTENGRELIGYTTTLQFRLVYDT